MPYRDIPSTVKVYERNRAVDLFVSQKENVENSLVRLEQSARKSTSISFRMDFSLRQRRLVNDLYWLQRWQTTNWRAFMGITFYKVKKNFLYVCSSIKLISYNYAHDDI